MDEVSQEVERFVDCIQNASKSSDDVNMAAASDGDAETAELTVEFAPHSASTNVTPLMSRGKVSFLYAPAPDYNYKLRSRDTDGGARADSGDGGGARADSDNGDAPSLPESSCIEDLCNPDDDDVTGDGSTKCVRACCHLASEMLRMYLEGAHADVVLEARGQRYMAHRSVHGGLGK